MLFDSTKNNWKMQSVGLENTRILTEDARVDIASSVGEIFLFPLHACTYKGDLKFKTGRLEAIIGENRRLLVTDEPVEFKK